MTNRLASERSPYLQQHASNPVDWYPWGEEAFARAQAEDRPILLSVGYSACHWCHVMERESFEDDQIAALMNERFVNIKVDREERPDVDHVYMAAVQAMTGQGGWPMTVFLTPQGRPYFGGTYFPPQDRYGRPGFVRVLQGAAEAYRQRPDEVERNADAILAHAKGEPQSATGRELTSELLDDALAGLEAAFEPDHGGFGQAPKFPQAMALEFLLQRHRGCKTREDRSAAAAVEGILVKSLDEMAAGGLHDQLAGGFHRYSTDDEWLVPHFEKMLYDNALLARLYLLAGQALGCGRWLDVGRRTLDWCAREMRDPKGGFYSALDADSEGEEGKYYAWTAREIQEVLGSQAEAFMHFYDVTETGNWEGKTLLRHGPGAEPPPGLSQAIGDLLAHRERRVRPGRDDKVVAAWNGLMLAAFATAAVVLDGDPARECRQIAEANAGFLLDEMWRDGVLLRIWNAGPAAIPGFLEDYANVAGGLLALYEATFEERWFGAARQLVDAAIGQFWDEAEGRFFDAGTRHEKLVTRPRNVFDNATPAGNSAMAAVLLRLGRLTGEARYHDLARAALEDVAGLLGRYPTGFGLALRALDFALADVREVAIAGSPADPASRRLLAAVQASYSPYQVVAAGQGLSIIPLLKDRIPSGGKAAAYVCRNFACQAPITDPEVLARLLQESAGLTHGRDV